MSEELTFRAAKDADLPFLLELRRSTMTEHLRLSGVEPSENERVERVLARFECAEIILLGGDAVGLLKVARGGKNWAAVHLSVLKANPARRLYERFGFRIVGENDQAYEMMIQ